MVRLFFFSSRRRHTRWNCDWSSDVCSSDLRDLATFAVDLAFAEGLVTRVPAGVPAVAESGIETRADVERMAAAGADVVLVGTSVARDSDPAAAVRALVGGTRK